MRAAFLKGHLRLSKLGHLLSQLDHLLSQLGHLQSGSLSCLWQSGPANPTIPAAVPPLLNPTPSALPPAIPVILPALPLGPPAVPVILPALIAIAVLHTDTPVSVVPSPVISPAPKSILKRIAPAL